MSTADARTEKGRSTRLRILNAAEVVIGVEGHAGATTRRIAVEAGVDKRILAYYFESREALLAEVVGRAAERVAETIEHELTAIPVGERSVDGLLGVVWNGIRSEPAFVRTYVAILGTGETDAVVRGVVERMSQDYTELLRRELEALGIPDDRARRAAAAGTVMIRGLLLSWVEGAPDALIDETLDVLVRGVGPPSRT